MPVPWAGAAPVVDGDLSEWEDARWVPVPVGPALEGDEKNTTGERVVVLAARMAGDRIYLAARWPDSEENREHRPWKRRGNRYRRGRERDDAFAVRFEMGGSYDWCMLTRADYEVDVWFWAAGRTDAAGFADDLHFVIGHDPLEDAAEYDGPDGRTVYIRKRPDEGEGVYRLRRKPLGAGPTEIPSVEPVAGGPTGSRADVKAKGVWRDGFWQVEFSRALDTGHADDARLQPGRTIRGAIAVFDRGYDQHKSVSGTLRFELAPAP